MKDQNNMTFVEIDTPRDTDGKFTEKEGQAPEVTLIPDNHRLSVEDGDTLDLSSTDLGDDIAFENVRVERDGDNYYLEGETFPVDFHEGLYPTLDAEAQEAALARDWKTIAETVNDTYSKCLDPSRPRNNFTFEPNLGEIETESLTSNKVRRAVLDFEDGEGQALAGAVRDGSLYTIVRNAIQQSEPEEDEDED